MVLGWLSQHPTYSPDHFRHSPSQSWPVYLKVSSGPLGSNLPAWDRDSGSKPSPYPSCSHGKLWAPRRPRALGYEMKTRVTVTLEEYIQSCSPSYPSFLLFNSCILVSYLPCFPGGSKALWCSMEGFSHPREAAGETKDERGMLSQGFCCTATLLSPACSPGARTAMSERCLPEPSQVCQKANQRLSFPVPLLTTSLIAKMQQSSGRIWDLTSLPLSPSTSIPCWQSLNQTLLFAISVLNRVLQCPLPGRQTHLWAAAQALLLVG